MFGFGRYLGWFLTVICTLIGLVYDWKLVWFWFSFGSITGRFINCWQLILGLNVVDLVVGFKFGSVLIWNLFWLYFVVGPCRFLVAVKFINVIKRRWIRLDWWILLFCGKSLFNMAFKQSMIFWIRQIILKFRQVWKKIAQYGKSIIWKIWQFRADFGAYLASSLMLFSHRPTYWSTYRYTYWTTCRHTYRRWPCKSIRTRPEHSMGIQSDPADFRFRSAVGLPSAWLQYVYQYDVDVSARCVVWCEPTWRYHDSDWRRPVILDDTTSVSFACGSCRRRPGVQPSIPDRHQDDTKAACIPPRRHLDTSPGTTW